MSSTVPSFFFFNDTATTEIYTLSLHDALPISKSDPAKVSGGTDILRALKKIKAAGWSGSGKTTLRSEEHTSELQSHSDLVCRLLLEKKKRASQKPRLLCAGKGGSASSEPTSGS